MSNAAVAADAPIAPKGKKKLIIIIAAVAVLLLAGAAAALLLLKKPAAADDDDDDVVQVEKAPNKAKTAKPDPKAVPVFAPLDPFTVNLADRETERYAQIAVTLELDEAKTADQIKIFMPAIRNNILMVLAHKTSAQILGAEGKVKLAGEIQRATSRALGHEVEEPAADDDEETPKKTKRKRKADTALPVRAVHFSNFIVQ